MTPDAQVLAALRMLETALAEYFSYSPSRRDDKALGAVETARQAAREAISRATQAK